jgi:hypothetical protein
MATMRTLAVAALLSARTAHAEDEAAKTTLPPPPAPKDLGEAYKQSQLDLKAIETDIGGLRRDLQQRGAQVTNLRAKLQSAYDNAGRAETLMARPFVDRRFVNRRFVRCPYVFPQNSRHIGLA